MRYLKIQITAKVSVLPFAPRLIQAVKQQQQQTQTKKL